MANVRAFPDADGLPMWLFILVILIAILSLSVITFVVWKKCVKRPRRQVSMSSSGSDLPARKVSVKKGRLVRASWNVSLTGPRFGSASSPDNNRHGHQQWPRPLSSDLSPRTEDQQSFDYFSREACGKNEAAGFLSRPWSGLSRKPTASTKRSLSFSRNRRSFRPSYISESANTEPDVYEKMPQATVTEVAPITWLESPRPFSPFAPLTMPRVSCDVPPPKFSLRSPDWLSSRDALPTKPSRTFHISRDNDSISSKPRRHQRDSSRLDPGWPITDLEAQQQQRSSTASSRSFLQEWSSVYYRWLARPSSPAVRESVNFSRRINSRPSTVVQSNKMEDDMVSLPSLSPMTYDDPPSPMSTTYSEKYPSRWNTGDRSSGVSKSKRGHGELSWLAGK